MFKNRIPETYKDQVVKLLKNLLHSLSDICQQLKVQNRNFEIFQFLKNGLT